MTDVEFERAGADELDELGRELRAARDRVNVLEAAFGAAVDRRVVSMEARRRARGALAVAWQEAREGARGERLR